MTDKKKSSGGKSAGSKASGSREMAVRLKTAYKRTTSQQIWLQRQLNDPYVAKAKEEGYKSRAAFKLLEIDDKYKLLKPGMRIVDLGAAPGGWCQVAAKRIKSTPEDVRIVAIDEQSLQRIGQCRHHDRWRAGAGPLQRPDDAVVPTPQ